MSNVTHRSLTLRVTKASDLETTSARLSYSIQITTSGDPAKLVDVRVNGSPAQSASLNGDAFKITGLIPETTYTLKIQVTDSDGNTANYLDISQKTHPLGVFLLSDLNQSVDLNYQPAKLEVIEFNGAVYFNGTDGYQHGVELWKYDGSNPPTLVVDINPGQNSSNPGYFFVENSKLYFKASDGTGDALWTVDGNDTLEMIGSTYLMSGVSNPYFTRKENMLYFQGYEAGKGLELFSMDLSADIVDGTNPKCLTNVPAPFAPREIVLINNTLYFGAENTSSHGGDELHSYDIGSETLTSLDIIPDSAHSKPTQLIVMANKLYFKTLNATNIRSRDLWQYDPSADTRSIYKKKIPSSRNSINRHIREFTAVDGRLFYVASEDSTTPLRPEMWCYDPNDPTSDQNPRKIELPSGESAWPSTLTRLGNYLYFSATDSTRKAELWRYNLTTDATPDLVYNLNGDDASDPKRLTVLGNNLYFTATAKGVSRLWMYDPNEATSDTNPKIVTIGSQNDSPSPTRLTTLSNTLYFYARDPNRGTEIWTTTPTTDPVNMADINKHPHTKGSSLSSTAVTETGTLMFGGPYQLWRYNYPNTVSTPVILTGVFSPQGEDGLKIIDFPFSLGNSVYYMAQYTKNGNWSKALSKIDETGQPTKIWDLENRDYQQSSLSSLGSTIYVGTYIGAIQNANEFWKVDTANLTAGAVQLDALSTAGLTRFSNFQTFNGSIYFQGADSSGDTELWKFTPDQNGGTASRVRNLNPAGSSFPRFLTVADNRLFFFHSGDKLAEYAANGTIREIKDTTTDGLKPPTASCVSFFTNVGNVIVFAATSVSGDTEIWRYAPGELARMFNLNTATDSDPSELVTFKNKVYFTADNGKIGRELWVFDASDNNAVPEPIDINPGPESSGIRELAIVEDALCFFANDGKHGLEPMCFHSQE